MPKWTVFLAVLLFTTILPTKSFADASVSATSVFTDYVATPVTTTPVTLISKASYPVREVHMFDSSGQNMKIVVTSGPFITTVFIPPGGDTYSLKMSQGDSLTIQAVSTSATTGINILTLLY